MKIPLLSVIVVFLAILSAPGADEPPVFLKAAQDRYAEQVAALNREQAAQTAGCTASYLSRLETLQTQIAARGDLDNAVLVRSERERVQKGVPPTEPERKAMFPDLLAQRNRYDAEVAAAAKPTAARRRLLLGQYITALDNLSKAVTATGDLDGALLVRAEKEKMLKEGNATEGKSAVIEAAPRSPGNSGADSFLAAHFFDQLGQGIRRAKKTKLIGSKSHFEEFTAVPPEAAYLAGVAVMQGEWFGTPIVSSLQPIFETARGRIRGRVFGAKATNLPLVAEAKPGYVVTQLIVSAPNDHVHGVKLVFNKLDYFHAGVSKESYESDWLVLDFKGSHETTGDAARPAIGICGRAGDWVAALGLLDAP